MSREHRKLELCGRTFLVLAASCTLSACATIVSGTMQSVKIDSNPQGARVTTAVSTIVNNKRVYLKKKDAGVTPTTVSIARIDGAVLLEKDGYHFVDVPLRRTTNPWMIGDLLMMSLLSTSIDTSTGAAEQYDPDEYMVNLKPIPPRPEIEPAEAPPGHSSANSE